MPKYKLPPLKKPKSKEAKEMAGCDNYYDDEWRRKIRLPANNEILEALTIDEEVTVTLRGKVCELQSRESDNQSKIEFEVIVSEVEAYPNTKDEANKSMKKGYDKLKKKKVY